MQLAQPLPPPLMHEQGKDQTKPLPDFLKRMRDAHQTDLRRFKFQNNRDAYEQILRYSEDSAAVPLTFPAVAPDVFAQYAAQFPGIGVAVNTAVLALEVSIVIVGNVWIASEYIFPAIRNWIEATDQVLPVFAQLLRLMPNSESKMEKRLTERDVDAFLAAVRQMEEATLAYALCARLLGQKLGKTEPGAWSNMAVDLQASTDPFLVQLQTQAVTVSPTTFQAMCASMGFGVSSAKALFSGVTGYVGPLLGCMLKAGAKNLAGQATVETIAALGPDHPLSMVLAGGMTAASGINIGNVANATGALVGAKFKAMVNSLRGQREADHEQYESAPRRQTRKRVGTKFNPPFVTINGYGRRNDEYGRHTDEYGRRNDEYGRRYDDDSYSVLPRRQNRRDDYDPYSAPPRQTKPNKKQSTQQRRHPRYDRNGNPIDSAQQPQSQPQYDPRYDANGNTIDYAQQMDQRIRQALPQRAPPRQTAMHTVLNEATGPLGTQVLGNYWGERAARNAKTATPSEAAMLNTVQAQLKGQAGQYMGVARQAGGVALDVTTSAYDRLQASRRAEQQAAANVVQAFRTDGLGCTAAGAIGTYWTSPGAIDVTQAVGYAVKENATPIISTFASLAGTYAGIPLAAAQLAGSAIGALGSAYGLSTFTATDVTSRSGMQYTVGTVLDNKLQHVAGLMAKLPVVGFLSCLDPANLIANGLDKREYRRERVLNATGYTRKPAEVGLDLLRDTADFKYEQAARAGKKVQEAANYLFGGVSLPSGSSTQSMTDQERSELAPHLRQLTAKEIAQGEAQMAAAKEAVFSAPGKLAGAVTNAAQHAAAATASAIAQVPAHAQQAAENVAQQFADSKEARRQASREAYGSLTSATWELAKRTVGMGSAFKQNQAPWVLFKASSLQSPAPKPFRLTKPSASSQPSQSTGPVFGPEFSGMGYVDTAYATPESCQRLATVMAGYAAKAYGVYQTASISGIAAYIREAIAAGWATFTGWISVVSGYIGSAFSWLLTGAQAFATAFIGLLQSFSAAYMSGFWLLWGLQALTIVGLTAVFLYFFAYPLMKWLVRILGKSMTSIWNFFHDPNPWSNPEYERAFRLHLREHLREPLEALKRLSVRTTPIELLDLNLLRNAIEHALATNPSERQELDAMRAEIEWHIRASNTQVFSPFPATGSYTARPLTTLNGR